MKTPSNTYRIQFHKDFNFQQFEQIIEYLHTLGVDTVYASPILQAVPGSAHGYDGTDMARINPEIGTLKQFIALRKKLRKYNIKWIQDIVPNHMAFHPDNAWLMDILEFGEASAYKDYFDTAYSSSLMQGKLMIPVLGKPLREVLASSEVQLMLKNGKLYLQYFEQQFPVSSTSYNLVLNSITNENDWFAFLANATNRQNIQNAIKQINGDKNQLFHLVDQQHYRLCHWQETDRQINFRRFFTVNSLICLNTHRTEVFEHTHAFIKKLLDEGLIDGLRVDHIDGLYDPTKYLQDLRKLTGPDTYIVAEKILEQDEELPKNWAIQGTTGYDFLAVCNQLNTDRNAKKTLTEFYTQLTGDSLSLRKQQIQKKAHILSRHMQGELDNLYRFFVELGLDSNKGRIDELQWKQAISAFLVYFPVYRLYETSFPFPHTSYETVSKIFDDISKDRYADRRAVRYLRKVFDQAQHADDSDYQNRVLSFWLRCMQFTGPLMAKGVEDTLMYTYHRFIGHNEVGDHPATFGMSTKAFHRKMVKRQMEWPLAMNGSATHDTKRGEDVRGRLQVLSTIPELWIAEVQRWQEIVEANYQDKMPDPNDIYFIYQTLFGTFPMPDEADDDFEARLHAYLEKALREGKQHSDWADPNEAYEQVVKNFTSFLVDKNEAFFPEFKAFLEEWVDTGIIHSLTQLILKFTCPGIPDTYQGTELWDFSFVDPDNRRPVDYGLRQAYLDEISTIAPENKWANLWEQRYNGKIKLWLTQYLLQLHKKNSALLTKGDYVPLRVTGSLRKNVLAFARRYRRKWLAVILPLHLGQQENISASIDAVDWDDTCVELPISESVEWNNGLQSEIIIGNKFSLRDALKKSPIAILQGQETEKTRTAGVLMHITSLPSPYGIGDLGKGAFDFTDQLKRSGQYWWQILPLNPVSHYQSYSPYSTWSAFAGNPMLIDPESLAEQGLLDQQDLLTARLPELASVDFPQAEASKTDLLGKAYRNVNLEKLPAFKRFCREHAHWLHDYALFVVLRRHNGNRPWHEWDPTYKYRDQESLRTFATQQRSAIDEVKWQQYVFFEQWQRLRDYCHDQDIRLLGDVPIYVGHDSADVWSNPQFFSLREDGSLQKVAGVPPDYFNPEGQLWGMPVFNWSALKKQHYKWWLQRLSHNQKLFDLVRLDHFRAFSSYWEVGTDETTAINGSWQEGPGKHFFNKIKDTFGELPFLAEDLGDINDAVHELREAYDMPGMKVLQFSFGEDMPTSSYIPHHHTPNFFVYTGTHDNNTTLGWYAHDLDEASKERLSQYMGKAINKSNICKEMIRLAYSSVANTAIVPMQDILALDEKHRMNSPATTENNWGWRMLPKSFDERIMNRLKVWAKTYGR